MKKTTFLSLFLSLYWMSALAFPVHAWQQTDEQNMSSPTVKVINKYTGSWKGWSDGCVNCYKPLASGKVDRSKKKAKRKPKSFPKSLRRGYCECSCDKENSTTKSMDDVEANDTSSKTGDKTKGKSAPAKVDSTKKLTEPNNSNVKDTFKIKSGSNDKPKKQQESKQGKITLEK